MVANFPVNFTLESARRLVSIVNSGPSCGVYTLITHDPKAAEYGRRRLHLDKGTLAAASEMDER